MSFEDTVETENVETQNYVEHGHIQMLKEIKHTVHRHLHLHQ